MSRTSRESWGEVVRRRLEALAGSGLAEEDPDELSPPEPAVTVALWRRGLAFGREHLVVVAVVALAGCGWAGYTMTQARSIPVTSVSPTPIPATSVSLSPTPAVPVQVHVLGAVHAPGVVTVTPGARVHEAIVAAGGLLDDADPGDLNLAAAVADGAQIKIGSAGAPGGELRDEGGQPATASGGGQGLVDLNRADLSQLDTLPGVGPVTAQRILDWRAQHGRFTRVEELQEVDGIGPKTYAQLAGKVTV